MGSRHNEKVASEAGRPFHIQEETGQTLNGDDDTHGGGGVRPRSPMPSSGLVQSKTEAAPPWETDPRGYYNTFYSQFANLIMISTFTGGVQAAVLAFMNDLLTALNVTLFPQDPNSSSRKLYSTFSLGLMLGLLAVALNLTVAAIAAVNAALACHFSLHLPADHKPSMEARIVFCMLIQFMASGLAGISLVLLALSFDKAFTIVTATLFFAGIVIAAYHLVALFGSTWWTKLRKQPLHGISLLVSTCAFAVDVATPSPSSWFTITTYGFTVTYHMLAVLHNRSPHGDRPRRLAIFGVVMIAGCWAGCAAVTVALKRLRGHYWKWDSGLMYAIIGLAGMEALVLLSVGVHDLLAMRRWARDHPSLPKVLVAASHPPHSK
ncbi:hypothetical protein MD484_g8736, partial [Candolleomyces efflorescens]